jgi:hypothetical protein
MTALEQAEALRQQAIAVLLDEREAIERKLKLLAYGAEQKTASKRRGRPPKGETGEQVAPMSPVTPAIAAPIPGTPAS